MEKWDPGGTITPTQGQHKALGGGGADKTVLANLLLKKNTKYKNTNICKKKTRKCKKTQNAFPLSPISLRHQLIEIATQLDFVIFKTRPCSLQKSLVWGPNGSGRPRNLRCSAAGKVVRAVWYLSKTPSRRPSIFRLGFGPIVGGGYPGLHENLFRGSISRYSEIFSIL